MISNLYESSKNGLLIIAIIISIFLIGNYLFSFESRGTQISDLVGGWKGQFSGHDIVLEIDSDSECTLLVSAIKGDKKFYTGRCIVDRKKSPTALSIRNLPAYDFNLHTIIERLDNRRILIAPFAKRKRSRPITFSDSIIMEKF